MSFVGIKSELIVGLKAYLVKVECDIGNAFSLTGLGDKAIDESKDRVCSSLHNAGYKNPQQTNHRTTISRPWRFKKRGN